MFIPDLFIFLISYLIDSVLPVKRPLTRGLANNAWLTMKTVNSIAVFAIPVYTKAYGFLKQAIQRVSNTFYRQIIRQTVHRQFQTAELNRSATRSDLYLIFCTAQQRDC